MTLSLNGGVYSMHVRRSGARAHRWFCFAPIVVPSSMSGERGVPLSVSLFTRRRHFWYACQRVERTSARNVFACTCAVFFNGTRWGEGKGMLAALYPWRRSFRHACHQVGRSDVHDLLFHAFEHCIFLMRRARIGCFRGFLPSAVALLVCMPADKKASVRDFCYIAFPPFNSSGLGGWARWGIDVSLTSGTALLVQIPHDREGEFAGHLILLRFRHSTFTD